MKLPKKNDKAEVYIGVIIALGIMLLLSQVIVTLAFSIYDFAIINRVRTSAKTIAQEQIEIIRNAEYNDVGTVSGIPQGIFAQEQNVMRNGQNYSIRTRINYIDDEFDGTAPEDTLPIDYKRIRVDVSWGGIQSSDIQTITMVTDIAPKGIETTAGGGTLSVLVFNSQAEPVPQAEVHIQAPSLEPPVDETYYTTDTGILTIPGAPICDSCYEITVTKDGYSTDKTYSPSEVENPIKPYATILESQLTEISFSIDYLASMQITTSPNQIINIHGTKIIGTDSLDQNVYKYDYDVVIGSSGTLLANDLEWDNYYISPPESSSIDIAYTNPTSPIKILPNDSINLTIYVVPDTTNTLHLAFEDSDENLIASVSATLTDGATYEETLITGGSGEVNFGQAFFENLENKIYSLVATASGYLEINSDINVDGDTDEIIILDSE